MTLADVETPLGPTLERLHGLIDRHHVPGLEIAVVNGDDWVHAGGVGVRGVDDPYPVTAQTLFEHGSCGKAFTGLLCAVLDDAGVLDLDAPVRRWVPELRLPDPVIAERATVRDLLSHRAGLGRHDLAWIMNPGWTREDVVRRLAALPMVGDLRAQCSYSNFGFTLAGLAVERATGRAFEDALADRVFAPAGFTRTYSFVDAALADDDHARAHVLRDDAPVETPWRPINAIKPAGGVVTCADDSVRWLRLQLKGGGIAADVVRRTQAIQVPVHTPSAFPELRMLGYGLGWMVGTYRRRPMIWHNGGIDGFLTNVLVLPEDGIAAAASANLHMSQASLVAVLELVDDLLGEHSEQSWDERVHGPTPTAGTTSAPTPRRAEPAPRARPLVDYAGRYEHAGYGELDVRVRGGGLAVRFGAVDLVATHRHHETWDLRYDVLGAELVATFHVGADGAIGSVVLDHDGEGSFTFERADAEEPA